MMRDLQAIVWKEWREVLRMSGKRRRAWLRLLFSIGLLGILWPWQLGPHFVTSKLAIVLSAFTASMYVAGVVPDSFAGERERHTLETLLATRLPDHAVLFGKIVALISYGIAAAVVMLAFGWATVNIVHHQLGIMFYEPVTLIGAVTFSIVAAGLMGAIGVLVSLRAATVKQAQQVLTTAVLVLVFIPVIVLPTMPGRWMAFVIQTVQRWGSTRFTILFGIAMLILQLLLYAIAVARFKRTRLILEQ